MKRINNKFVSDVSLQEFIENNFTEYEESNIRSNAALRMILERIRKENSE